MSKNVVRVAISPCCPYELMCTSLLDVMTFGNLCLVWSVPAQLMIRLSVFFFSLKTRNQQLCQSKFGPFGVWTVEKSTDFFSEKKEAKKHKEAFAMFSFYCKSFSLNRIPLFSWTLFKIFAWFPLNTFFFVSKIKNSLLSFFIISCFFIWIFTILQTFHKTLSDRPQFFLQKKSFTTLLSKRTLFKIFRIFLWTWMLNAQLFTMLTSTLFICYKVHSKLRVKGNLP